VSKGQPPEGITPPAAAVSHLAGRLREIIEHHRLEDSIAATGHRCRCGANELSDHPRHVAQEIVARLGLQPERAGHLTNEIRYVSAWFDDRLTKLEGAE
jgi:hypothetical protein